MHATIKYSLFFILIFFIIPSDKSFKVSVTIGTFSLPFPLVTLPVAMTRFLCWRCDGDLIVATVKRDGDGDNTREINDS